MKLKKYLTVLAAIAVCAAGVPLQKNILPAQTAITACAAETEDGLTYYSNQGEVWITGTTSKDITTAVIPEKLRGAPVTRISYDAFKNCTSLESVEIPDTVTVIGQNAFMGCTSLKTVKMSQGITKIERYAFWKCSALTAIELPDTLEKIETYAFVDCTSLADIRFPGKMPALDGYVFSGSKWMDDRIAEDPCVVVNGVLLDGHEVSGVCEIPEGTTLIASHAFANNSHITGVVYPGTLTTIGEYAFHNCLDLEIGTIPDTITSIEDGAFTYAHAEELVIPGSVRHIGEYAFQHVGLKKLTIEDGTESLGRGAFANNAITELEIAPSVTQFGGQIFYGSPWLKERMAQDHMLILNDTLVEVENPSGAVGFRVPDGVKEIGGAAFDCCNFKVILFPESVVYLQPQAMRGITVNYACFMSSAIVFDKTYTDTVSVDHGAIYGHAGSESERMAGEIFVDFRPVEEFDYDALCAEFAPAKPAEPMTGDLTGDGEINASDAAQLLMIAAKEGATGEKLLTDEQRAIADVNKSGTVDASDAAIILMYSAAVGTGFGGTIEDFLNR